MNANQIELDAIVTGIQRVGLGTTFLGQKLFGQVLQSDASDAGTSTGDLDPTKMGTVYDQKTGQSYSLVDLRSTGALEMNGNPQIADEVVDAAIKQVASWQASLGTFQQTLSVMGDVRGVTRVNLADAYYRQIEDGFCDGDGGVCAR